MLAFRFIVDVDVDNKIRAQIVVVVCVIGSGGVVRLEVFPFL